MTYVECHFRTFTTWNRWDCFTPSSWGLQVSYDTIQCLITRLQFDIIAVNVNYLGKVKSTENSKILNLLINGFYHSNKSSADFQRNYKLNINSKLSKSRKWVRNSPFAFKLIENSDHFSFWRFWVVSFLIQFEPMKVD